MELERARDKRLVHRRRRWRRRELPQADAPGGEVGLGREAHLHIEVAGDIGEGLTLRGPRRIFGAQQIRT